MPYILDIEKRQINAEFKIEYQDGIFGLILESRGPTDRNSGYNEALETILGRLIFLNVPYVNIFLISKNLIKFSPDPKDRSILISGKNNISLNNQSSRKLRLAIGRRQAAHKVDKLKKGGNPTKRILIHNSNIDHEFWDKIAKGEILSESFFDKIAKPTNRKSVFDSRVNDLLFSDFQSPNGTKEPEKSSTTVETFKRDPKVKAWILKNSGGICESCNKNAQFNKDNGLPYIEVHHVIPLADKGSDTLSNTIAVCPNCHRALHYSSERNQIKLDLINKVSRLESV